MCCSVGCLKDSAHRLGPRRIRAARARSSVGERSLHTREVAGSSPAVPIRQKPRMRPRRSSSVHPASSTFATRNMSWTNYRDAAWARARTLGVWSEEPLSTTMTSAGTSDESSSSELSSRSSDGARFRAATMTETARGCSVTGHSRIRKSEVGLAPLHRCVCGIRSSLVSAHGVRRRRPSAPARR
jgi:hypothetical protein